MSANPTTVPTEVPRCEADEEAAENFRKGFNAGVEAERERCAGIAKRAFDRLDTLNTEDAGVMRQVWDAIKEGKS